MSNAPKYPTIEVQLTGQDGNAFAIMGEVTRAMKRDVGEGRTFETRADAEKACDEDRSAAMSGDYDNLLRVSMQTVTVL